jgi:hypothetical protein
MKFERKVGAIMILSCVGCLIGGALHTKYLRSELPKQCQSGHLNCATIDSFVTNGPFVLTSGKEKLKRATASNGISAVLKCAEKPTQSLNDTDVYQGLLPQPWIEVYATELGRLFGMDNLPCVRSMRFFFDELLPGSIPGDIHPHNIFAERGRQFIVCSVAAVIPDLITHPFPSSLAKAAFMQSANAVQIERSVCTGSHAIFISDVFSVLALDALLGNWDRIRGEKMGSGRLRS